MIDRVRIVAVLDTNVIYPVTVRDILFWFAHYDLYIPKWSPHIFAEWQCVMERKGVSNGEAKKRTNVANLAFPDALVHNYEGLLDILSLPDPNDRHVLAVAIKANANIIVSNNVKDFPTRYLETFGLEIKSPNDFLIDLIDLDRKVAVQAFRDMVSTKRNPCMDEYQVLDRLKRCGLTATANYLHVLL